MTHADRTDLRHTALAFAVVLAIGLLSGWRSFWYYWNWDDLHLMRVYSPAELGGALVGHWDPDHMETLGWRPVTALFNHVRSAAFGETRWLHRGFLLVLFAGALAIVTRVARQLGASPPAALLGVSFAMVAKNSYYHYIWIADGVHVLQLFFVALALPHATAYARTGAPRSLRTALGWTLLALLTREDSLAAFPALVGIGVILDAHERGSSVGDAWARAWPRTFRLASGLAVIFVACWLWRLAAISNAPQFKLQIQAIARVRDMVYWMVSLVGTQDPARFAFVALACLASVFAWRLAPDARRRACFWLGAGLVACLIGNVRARVNLLVFPALFYGLFLGEVFDGVRRWSRWAAAATALAVGLAGAAAIHASWLEQLSLHPLSAEQIYHEWQLVDGPYTSGIIPAERLATVRAKLRRVGMDRARTTDEFIAWGAALRERGRVGFHDDGEPFVMPRTFLEGPMLGAAVAR